MPETSTGERAPGAAYVFAFALGQIAGGLCVYTYWTLTTQRWLWSWVVAMLAMLAGSLTIPRSKGATAGAGRVTLALVGPPAVVVIACIALFQGIEVGNQRVLSPVFTSAPEPAATAEPTPAPKAKADDKK